MTHLSKTTENLARILTVCALLVLASARWAPAQWADRPLFEAVAPARSGVTFSNDLREGPERNLLAYEYFYNGGGVAVGDVNDDGRPDLYFTANQKPNALYLNEGDFQFREVTEAAGVSDAGGWKTGVTMADVNGDGRLDLYVCHSGWQNTGQRRNRLFINQGTGEDDVPRFEEQAEDYGLDDASRSTHATFFDYDRDGDLDLYLLNHATGRTRFDVPRADRQKRGALAGDKLYRNDNGSFTDVSKEAGIIGSAAGYGLSATVSDINRDGWPDLYVANDYLADDRLYVNQGDGTFEEKIRAWLDHTSYSSMGSDIADVTGDGRPDILSLDMMAEGQKRQKLLSGPKDLSFYQSMQARDYFFQYQRNMLHRNDGTPPGRETPSFSEVGQIAGVAQTDWSWAALFADFDLDGRKDLYVTNGFRRDYTNLDVLHSVLYSNLDYLKYRSAENPEEIDADLYGMTRQMPSTPIPNYAFRNAGTLRFEKRGEQWGLAHEGFSTGAAYADLDGDGALDLVVNNVDEVASIYRNRAREQTGRNYLTVDLDGPEGNPFAVGTKVELRAPDGHRQYQEMIPARGFQSSVQPALHFGLRDAETVDLTVIWPDGSTQAKTQVAANQTLTLEHHNTRAPKHQNTTAPETTRSSAADAPGASRPLFSKAKEPGLSFTHRENAYVDFEAEPLLPHMHSRLGPALARGDITGDGREDLFVGGARGQSGALFVQAADGTFEESTPKIFSAHRGYEDVDATFFDADGDGDQDLYVVSGGRAARGAAGYQDRLYLNDGRGSLAYAPGALPEIQASGGAVAAHDYDGDGLTDLFVGGRLWIGQYPLPPRSFLLKNDGGTFKDVTARKAPLLFKPGMVTDALWHDVNADGQVELLIGGEWMPLRVFRLSDTGLFDELTAELGLEGATGWWNALTAADLNGDGRAEIVAGNRGLNAPIRTSQEEPAAVWAADFARDGDIDPVMTHYLEGKEYPVFWHDRLVEAIPPFEPRFDSYEDYATATFGEILTDGERKKATRLTARVFETSLFRLADNGTFEREALPRGGQLAPIRAIEAADVTGDGQTDLLLAGNDFTARPQWGRADAEKGTVLRNEGSLQFTALPSRQSGFYAPKDVRALVVLETATGSLVVVGNNNGPVSVFSQ